jgi:Tfp pilus assembly protein PilF
MQKIIARSFISLIVFATSIQLSHARGSEEGYGSDWTQSRPTTKPNLAYDKGTALVKEGKFSEAVTQFEEALKSDPENPDVLNMLAYSQRNVGRIEDAFTNYKKALMLRPVFPQAREYLGEAYIQAVIRELDILKSYGAEGKEDYDKLSKALKEAAGKY